MVVPRVILSVKYIMSELEEIEREDNFRLKRFKELKNKKNKGNDTNKQCFCVKTPEKGDDFVCFVCRQKEEKRKESKKRPGEIKIQTLVPEVIGDKASTLSTAYQKRLDDLTEHLEKVISLTCQCKLDGLVSPSVDRFIYACKEVRCKLDSDQKQTAELNDEQEPQSCCDACENTLDVHESQEIPCEVCKDPGEQQDKKEEDSLGYFETKFKEIVKVMKFKNEDGTISEEKQVVTVKTEKKHPHKPNESGVSPCCKIKQIDSITSEESKADDRNIKDDKVFCKYLKESKSEKIPSCMKKEQTKSRPCISDSGESRKKNANESSIVDCKVCDTATEPEPRISYVCCPKTCLSENGSTKSKVSIKSSKKSNKTLEKELSKKDVSCECKAEAKSVCCDPVWKDVASSTTDLAENSEEMEELCICIKESDSVEPSKKADKMSISQKSATSGVSLCCDKKTDMATKATSSHTCSICSKNSKSMKDISTSTSNIEIEENSVIKGKPSSIKSHSCIIPPSELRKSRAKIARSPESCCKDFKVDKETKRCKDIKTDNKTCCKIRIVSKQAEDGKNDAKVQEFIFFGNILDAIKKILTPSKSDGSIKNVRDTKETDAVTKTCSCTSKNVNLLSKKSSPRSSICKTCETASQVSSDGLDSSTYISCKEIEKSQSCPQCSVKNDEKSISWSRPRSHSTNDACHCRPLKDTLKPSCRYKPGTDISKCSICGRESSKVTQSDTTSLPKNLSQNLSEDEEGISCGVETCTRTAASSAINLNNDQEQNSCVCHLLPGKTLIKPSKSNCRICHSDKTKGEALKHLKKDSHACHFDEYPCKCHPSNDLTRGPSEKMEPLKSKCKICYPEGDPCVCHASKNEDTLENPIKPAIPTCKLCQTERPSRKQDDSQKSQSDQLCPLCSKQDQQSNGQQTERKPCNSVPNVKSVVSLCSGYTPHASKNETSCIKNTEEKVMKDASTSTRRSDRYDVRPLMLIKPNRKMACTCHSDSCLIKSSPPLKRRSSCHANYYK